MCLVMELRGPSLLAAFDLKQSPHCRAHGPTRNNMKDSTSSDGAMSSRGNAVGGLHASRLCSWSAVADVARNIFTALAHLARREIIHADIKPDNILTCEVTAEAMLARQEGMRRMAEAAKLHRSAESAGKRMRAALLSGADATVCLQACDSALASLASSSSATAAAQARAARAHELLRSVLENPKVVLADLGNSFHTREASMYKTDYHLQPAGYRAPEVIIGRDFDCKIDVFSVGVVLLELCAGCAGVLLPSNAELEQAKAIAIRNPGISATRQAHQAV